MKYADILAACDPMQSHWDVNETLLFMERYDVETVVEIGCYQGGSLATWTHALQPSLAIGITRDESELVDFPAKARPNTVVRMIFGLSQDQTTVDATKQALDGRLIDFLFIDGGHSFREVQHDFLLYSPLMSATGVVGIHDLNRGAQDILRFWDGYIAQDYRSIRVADAAHASGLGIGLVLGPAVGSWEEQAARYDFA